MGTQLRTMPAPAVRHSLRSPLGTTTRITSTPWRGMTAVRRRLQALVQAAAHGGSRQADGQANNASPHPSHWKPTPRTSLRCPSVQLLSWRC